MAEVSEDVLIDLVNSIEDLTEATKAGSSAPPINIPESPAPVVNVTSPATPAAPNVTVRPQITVENPRPGYRIRVIERDRAGRMKEIEAIPM